MLRIPGDDGVPEGPPDPPARHGSAAAAVGEELLSAAVDLPWDDWLGPGAGDRVRDGSLGLVRLAYPATAAADMRAAATPAGMLTGDAAARERLGAIALAVAAAHARPARMPHVEGEEPYAWWVSDERTLVWMPWTDTSQRPYGLELIDSGQADAVTVAAPDAVWTVYATGLPRRGAAGAWADLPERFRTAVLSRGGATEELLTRAARWRRDGDTVTVRWRERTAIRSIAIVVNRPDATRSAALDPRL